MNDALRRIFTAEFRMEMVDENRVQGHASVFNRLAPIGRGYEEIGPNAFDEVLQRSEDVRFLLNHNPDNLLGRTKSGTLRLGTDANGLVVDDDLPETTLGHDVRILVRRRDLTGFSFGFAPDPKSDTFRMAPDGKQITTRNNIARMLDASLATYPAYGETDDAVLRAVDFSNTPRATDRRSQLIRARSRLYTKGS
jgi:HK97 family phage prohead protease